MGAAPPSGTVTVVLGDVAGSTRRWQEQPDAMARASRRLAELLDDLTAVHGGHLPREQGEGDNFVAVFAAAHAAAAFAIALDRAVTVEPWPDGLTVGMRIGLHTGDVVWDDRTGYLGPTFNRCARLRDLGHAQMLLLSQATCDIVADMLPDGATVVDLGLHQLRDLSRVEHVFQLCHADSPAVFLPLKSVSSLPNNLPVPVTSLVGRRDEIPEISRLLLDHRLVTLTGAGGSGKTRLAQHVASEVLHFASDGAWWVDLMPVAEEVLVPTAIAAAAGIDEVSNVRSLAGGIGDARMLLVLDNCEHVIDAVADIVEELLTSCREVRVLATSRETVGIDGEHAVRVRSLSVPHGQVTADELDEYDATHLFVERAQAAGPFTPDDRDAGAVATICRRLDGIPLAIELAAARTRVVSVQEIAQGLDDRFSLLGATGRRRGSSRQRTLEASVAWSFGLLGDEEQAVLCRLGVFPSAFSLDGASRVGKQDSDGGHLLDVLTSLVDKSLVTVRPDEQGRRYRLLETIRQYALDRLAERGEAEAARDAHLDHVLAVMEDRRARLHERMDHGSTFDDWGVWGDDVRAAAEWALRRDRPEDVVALFHPNILQLVEFGGATGVLPVLRPLLDDHRIEGLTRAHLQTSLACVLYAAGDPVAGLELARQAVAHVRDHGTTDDLVHALHAVSLCGPTADGSGQAEAQEAIELAGDAGGPGVRAWLGTSLAVCHLMAGNIDEAVGATRTAAEACGLRGTPLLELTNWSMHAIATSLAGRLTVAATLATEVHERMLVEAPRLLGMHVCLGGFWPCAWVGQAEQSRGMVADADRTAGPIGTTSRVFADLGRVLVAYLDGDADAMVAAAERALAILEHTTMRSWTQVALAHLALGLVWQGRADRARQVIEHAEAMAPPPPWWGYLAGLLLHARLELAADEATALNSTAAWLARGDWRAGHRAGWTVPTLVRAAAAMCSTGREEQAARVLGAHDTLMASFDTPLTFEPFVSTAGVRTQLAHMLGDRYDPLVAEGTRMPLGGAVDLVLAASTIGTA